MTWSDTVSRRITAPLDGAIAPGTIPLRVMVVDDHPMMREGIAASLDAMGGMDIVATACNGEEAIAEYDRSLPDVALIDMQMPVLDGLQAIVRIRARHPRARIIALTTFGGDVRVADALRAGAAAYLLKDVRAADLAQAIRTVHQGAALAAPGQREAATYHPADALSARELDVLRLAAGGNSNRRIGDLLNISEPTVKCHMSAILEKLGANDRTHAVTLSLRRGYITL